MQTIILFTLRDLSWPSIAHNLRKVRVGFMEWGKHKFWIAFVYVCEYVSKHNLYCRLLVCVCVCLIEREREREREKEKERERKRN